MTIQNLLKRLCYRQQGNNWYKTIGYTLVLVKLDDIHINMAQVFTGTDNKINVWSSGKDELSNIKDIEDLIALEVTVCRDIYYFPTDLEGLNIIIPQLTMIDLIEL